MRNNHLVYLTLISALGSLSISYQSMAQEGIEVRAAKVCAGVGETGWNAQGPLKVDDLSVQGDVSGTITVKRNGVDLGKIEKGSYQNYTSCLIEVIKLLAPPPPATPRPRQEFNVCMGNGGGQSCAAGADAVYNCDTYNAMGGGSQRTLDLLVKNFCEYNDNGTLKLAPNKVIVTYDVGGGQCGWTGFRVICNP
jgi:hypothetical protein